MTRGIHDGENGADLASEELGPMSPDVAEIARALRRQEPPPGTVDTILRGLDAKLAAEKTVDAPKGTTGLPIRKVLVITGLAVLGVIALVVSLSPNDGQHAPQTEPAKPRVEATPAAERAPSEPPVTPAEPVPPSPSLAPALVPAATPSASAAPASAAPDVAPVAEHTSTAPSELDEAALLARARRALHGSPARALPLVRSHQRRFPNGILTEERDVIEVEALVALHDARAAAAAERFLARYAASVHAAHVRQLLGQARSAP